MNNLKYLNILSTIVIIAGSVLSNSGLLGGDNNRISSDYYLDQGKIDIFPSGLAFSIWGLIFIMLILFSLTPWLSIAKPELISQINNKISYMYLLNAILNVSWLYVFARNYQGKKVIFPTLIMLGLLLSLIYICKNLLSFNFLNSQKLYLLNPFLIYLTWVFFAAILNLTFFLREYQILKVGGLGEKVLFRSVEIISILISIFAFKKNLTPVLGVVAWLFFNVYLKNKTPTSLLIFILQIPLLLKHLIL